MDAKALESYRQASAPDLKAHRAIVIGSLAVSVVSVIALIVHSTDGDAPLAVEAIQVVPMSMQKTSSASSVLDASGYVVARRQATISSKITGRVKQVLIEEGASVTAGQAIAHLDDSTARPQLALAESEVDRARKGLAEVEVRRSEAERALARLDKLRNTSSVSEAELDKNNSELSALKARLSALNSAVSVAEGALRVRRQDLTDLVIRAPFDGVVVSKDAQPGEMVSPVSAGSGYTRTGIATIVDMKSLEIDVDVNEAFINRVVARQQALAVLDAYPEWEIPSHVINIVPSADRQKATVRVRLAFDALDPRIFPEMGVKVKFLDVDRENTTPAESDALVVPASAVVVENDRSYVWKIVENRAAKTPVTTASARPGFVQVRSGIAPNDLLIASVVEGLTEGAMLRVSTPGRPR